MQPHTTQGTTGCPYCRKPLPVLDRTAYCPDCDLHLAGIPTRGRRLAAYALSLPERVSRVALGSAAGVLKGASELILPEAARRSKLYQVLLNKNLRYLIREVGAVKGVYADESTAPSRYVARKFVGNFVEITGLLTLRASPVWIFALLSDLAGGTKIFLKELVNELKREGILAEETQVENVDQLLEGIQSFAGSVADQIDTPPLSVQELRETLSHIRAQVRSVKSSPSIPKEEMDSMFEEMRTVAEKENKSVHEISTAMAISATNALERSGRTAVSGLRVARSLLDQSIFTHYAKALKQISHLGYYRYLARSSKPYFRAIGRHLAWRNITWTERYFLSHTWGRSEQQGQDATTTVP